MKLLYFSSHNSIIYLHLYLAKWTVDCSVYHNYVSTLISFYWFIVWTGISGIEIITVTGNTRGEAGAEVEEGLSVIATVEGKKTIITEAEAAVLVLITAKIVGEVDMMMRGAVEVVLMEGSHVSLCIMFIMLHVLYLSNFSCLIWKCLSCSAQSKSKAEPISSRDFSYRWKPKCWESQWTFSNSKKFVTPWAAGWFS